MKSLKSIVALAAPSTQRRNTGDCFDDDFGGSAAERRDFGDGTPFNGPLTVDGSATERRRQFGGGTGNGVGDRFASGIL
jgi:hypothetical protein